MAAFEACCCLWGSTPKGRLLTDRQLQGFDLFSQGRRFEYKYKYCQSRLHKWQTACITLDMCHRQAFIEIQQVSFIKYRLILADLWLQLLQIQLKMSLQKYVFSHVSLKASEPLIKQIWKILKRTAKGKQSCVFLEHKLAGGKGHSIDRLQTKGTSFSGSCKQKSSFPQKCDICELKMHYNSGKKSRNGSACPGQRRCTLCLLSLPFLLQHLPREWCSVC